MSAPRPEVTARRRRLCALPVFLLLGSSVAMGQAFRPAVYLPIAASIVRVEADLDQGHLSVGSGVTVAQAVIATNCHVVRDATSIRIAGAGATWYVDAERGDLKRDVCFLRAPGWTGQPVTLSRADRPVLQSMVVALGFTAGAAITPRVGAVSAVHDFDGAGVIESNASFNSGASGGGLFDEEGSMVGLLAFRRRDSTTSYYALPVQWVREAMSRDDDWKEVHPLSGPAAFWQGDEAQLPAFMRIEAAR